MDFVSLFLRAGILIAVYMSFVWLLSVPLRNTSIVDVFWGPGFFVVSAFYAVFAEGADWRIALILALVALWGFRLAVHILVRSQGKGEDKRYAAWRRKHGKNWWWRSFFTVFLLQGLIMWLVSLCLLGAQHGRFVPEAIFADIIGIALFAAGFLFESVADWQLLRFQRDPESKGRVLDTGLWAWSRHPNYFGECLIWWGFWFLALAPGHPGTVVSPLIMTVLLLKVSGVTLLEKSLEKDKPGYAEYAARTSAFVPRPPKR